MSIITGPNGSGKTVLGRLLTGLSPSLLDGLRREGEIEVTFGPIRPHVPRRFAYLPQGWSLSFLGSRLKTDLEIVERRLQIEKNDIFELFQDSGLNPASILYRSPSSLSRGERQRIALAFVTSLRPRALYLDEPDAFLDDDGLNYLKRCLYNLIDQGTRIIVSTHHPEYYDDFAPSFFSLPGDKMSANLSTKDFTDFNDTEHNNCAHNSKFSFVTSFSTDICPERRLEVISLPLMPRHLTAVFGKNGSGKTSLLRELCIRARKNLFESSSVMVSEEADDQLLFRTIEDELILHNGTTKFNDIQKIALQQLGGKQQNVAHLSWGMRRLLTILLAVLSRPQILLVDEPDAGLDRETASLVKILLKDACTYGSAVLVTANRKEGIWHSADFRAEIVQDNNLSRVMERKTL